MCIPNELWVNAFDNATCPDDNLPHFTVNMYLDGTKAYRVDGKKTVSEKAYEANVHFNLDEHGSVISIDVCLIAPMPECDPNEPIPYEITELGKGTARKYGWPGYVGPYVKLQGSEE